MAVKKQRKGDATREALMNAGFKVFAEKGFLRARVEDIVRAAGKSNGVFHIYFKNKDALLDAWMDECDKKVPWYQAEMSLLFEKAHHFTIESYWTLYENYGPVLDALEAAALVSTHFEKRLGDLRRKGTASIACMIHHAQSRGRCCGIDPELTAVSISAVISNATAYWFEHRLELEARGFDRVVALASLDTLLYARMLDLEGGASRNENVKAVKESVESRRRSP